jgi:ribonuclease-3
MKKEEGEKHQKKYTMAVKVGNEILGVGEGKSKKEAEQKAAEMAFRTFKIM